MLMSIKWFLGFFRAISPVLLGPPHKISKMNSDIDLKFELVDEKKR